MKKTIAIFVSLDLYRYDLVLPTPAIRAAADGQLAVAERGKAKAEGSQAIRWLGCEHK
jgi:hypothetical protein